MNESQNRPEGSLGDVFVVDDDAAVRQTLATILSHAGYHVTDFAEGEAFLELARRTTPICIFLDVHMPGMSGIEAFAKINGQQPEQKIASFHFPGRPALTRRECDALQLFTSGSSNKEAARELGLSPRTIEEHRANIMKKLGAKNAADLIRIVLTEGRASKQTI
eukprot:gene12731-12827_t